jgi:hypothetical protein
MGALIVLAMRHESCLAWATVRIYDVQSGRVHCSWRLYGVADIVFNV